MSARRAPLLLAALFGCAAPPAEPPEATPAAQAAHGEGRVEGVVRIVGSTPVGTRVVLELDQGRAVLLTGPLREELRALSGARVVVTGPVHPAEEPGADRQVAATGYEILAVDGAPVTTGTVEGRVGTWTVLRTPPGELVYLGGAADQLRAGQKVWVQGQRSLIVQSYGVLRP